MPEPSLWQSQQALEKYFKCILLLHRIPGKRVGHSLSKALHAIEDSKIVALDLTPATKKFITRINDYGAERCLTISTVAFGQDVVSLDRAVWELRRFCTLDPKPRTLKLMSGVRPARYSINGGWLEKCLSSNHYARKALICENAFWGKGRKTKVQVPGWMAASNAPLYMHPEILPLAKRYIMLPLYLQAAYEVHQAPHLHVPEEGIEMDLSGLRAIKNSRANRDFAQHKNHKRPRKQTTF